MVLGYWHLLSLDAPTVAALWTWFIGRCAGIQVPWSDVTAMFCVVWMLYAGDRLLDARAFRSSRTAVGLEARHLFHYRHRAAFAAVMLLIAPLAVFLLLQMEHAVLALFAVLGGLLATWFCIVHVPSAKGAQHRPKELMVGLFFAPAVCFPTFGRNNLLASQLWLPALLFAVVCILNCVFISMWESAPRADTFAHCSTQWLATRHFAASVFTASVAGAGAAWLARTNPRSQVFCLLLACAISTLLLLGLHVIRRQLSPVVLRACADVCLLTPLLLLPVLHVDG